MSEQTNNQTQGELKMILVKKGTFTMGSPEDEPGRFDDEHQHEVTIEKDFYIGECPVTQGEYNRVMGHNPSDPATGLGPAYPVNCVSWYDAVKYCNALSKEEGLTPAYIIDGDNVTLNPDTDGYRLPTEEQWEYAARGGHKSTGYKKYAGSDNIDEVAWYAGNSNDRLHPVGQKKPNELGLYDMSGNVWEWCQDESK